jgi:hypothetical protein
MSFRPRAAGAVEQAASAVLAGVSATDRSKVWKMVLVADATRADYRSLASQIAINRAAQP